MKRLTRRQLLGWAAFFVAGLLLLVALLSHVLTLIARVAHTDGERGWFYIGVATGWMCMSLYNVGRYLALRSRGEGDE